MIPFMKSFFIVIFIALGAYLAVASNNTEILISYTEVCPFMCTQEKNRGFVTDIAEAVFTTAGYKVNFLALPWARAISDINSGKTDAIISAAKSEAPGLIFPSQEIAMQSDCIFGRKDDDWVPGEDVKSYKGRKTIVFSGWTKEIDFKKELGQDEYDNRFQHFSMDHTYLPRSIKMISLFRADGFWMEPQVVQYFFKNGSDEKQKSEIKNLGCIKRQKLYIGFSPNKPELSKKLALQFDEGITALRQNGKLKLILDKYNLKDWK